VVKKPHQKTSAGLSRRLHFPDDEKRIPWLSALLDTFAIVDTGVAIALRDAEKKEKKKLACSKSCDVCCRQTDIPLYPHELVGLYWFVSEKMSAVGQDLVKQQLVEHAPGSPCPFLVDHSCVVHPMRPVSCRQFNVFTTPCAPGEDPYYSRRDDVLVPIVDYTDRAFAAVLPFYQMDGGKDIGKSVKLIRTQIMNLQEYDWKRLVKVMEEIDSGKG
jgi:Fe-S-cluster containining protein